MLHRHESLPSYAISQGTSPRLLWRRLRGAPFQLDGVRIVATTTDQRIKEIAEAPQVNGGRESKWNRPITVGETRRRKTSSNPVSMSIGQVGPRTALDHFERFKITPGLDMDLD